MFLFVHTFCLVCAHVCVDSLANSSAYFRFRKKGVIAAESGYCVLYQADKPIRDTTIDINFPSPPLSPPLLGGFSFNGRVGSVMTCEEL